MRTKKHSTNLANPLPKFGNGSNTGNVICQLKKIRMNRLTLILLAFTIILTISCIQTTKKTLNINTESVLTRDTLLPIIANLTKYNRVEDKQIGEGGSLSEVYEEFERLIKIANDSELVNLTYHKNPSVRIYAFWGLAKRNYKGILDILNKHLNDTMTISYMAGCKIGTYRVNEFYLEILRPNHIDNCFKLKEIEIEKYKKRIENNKQAGI
jgi:hypothetical protein